MMTNPLEFLKFDETKLHNKDLEQVQEELTKSYNGTTMLMRNGRPFWYNFNRMFGNAKRRHGIISDAEALQLVYLIRDPSEEDGNEKVLVKSNTVTSITSKIQQPKNMFTPLETY